MDELWVKNNDGRTYNLSNPMQAKLWLKNLNPKGVDKFETVTTNDGKIYSIDECPDKLILDFCQYIANQMGKITENGMVN